MDQAASGWVVFYDAAAAGIDAAAQTQVTLGKLGVAIGVVVLVVTVVLAIRLQNRVLLLAAFLGSWLIGFSGLGWFGYHNVVVQQQRCIDWLEGGTYEVVTGKVEDLRPMPGSGYQPEIFTVSGVRFEYSDSNLSQGGFHQTRLAGGPIDEGRLVRITYHEGRILRLEVWTSSLDR